MPSVLSKEVVWAEVPDYDNYEVSNCGHVRHGDFMMHPSIITNKYRHQSYVVGLSKNNKQKWFLVHQLMAYAFELPKPENAIEIDHRNRDSLDNHLSNLYWVTKLQNQLNRKMPKHNTSGYRGVTRDKQANKWKSYYHLNNKKKHIICSDDPLVCYIAYLTKMIETYGDDCPIETKNDFKKYCEIDD